MEKMLGYIIGATVAISIIAVTVVLTGSAVVGVLSAIVAFPVAAPLTTTALIAAVVIGYATYKWKRR